MINKIWNEFDVLCYTVISISVSDVHQFLSIFGLCVSILYGFLKLKADFFNKKNK